MTTPRQEDGGGAREREQMLASINANLAGTCVYRTVHFPDGRMDCTYVSPNAEALIGLPAAAILADASLIFGLIPAEERPAFRQSIAAALVSGGMAAITVRLRHVSRGEIWVQFRSQLVERRADGAQVRDGVAVDITAARAAEAELRAVRQRLELALRSSRTCIWEDDLPANRITLDAIWAEMRGHPPCETVTTWRALLAGAHPEDRAAIMAQARRAIRGETDEYQIEQRMKTADGGWIWIMSHGRVIERDARGRARRMIGTNTDITARKHAEAEVRRQAEFLAALNETTLDLLNRRDVPDLLRALIERAAQLLEAPNVELLLKEGDELVVQAFTSNVQSAVGLRVSRAEAPLSWRALDARETVVLADYAAFPHAPNHYDAHGPRSVMELPVLRGGERLGVISLARSEPDRPFTPEERRRGEMLAQQAALVLHNATLRAEAWREAEARTVALRESEERHRAVFEHSPMIIGLLSVPDGRLVEFNAAGIAAFGYTREEAMGRTSVELELWADPAERERYLTELRTKGRVTGFEARMRRKNGELLTILYSGSLIEIGGRTYSLNSLEDISARRQAEGALKASEERLALALDATSDGLWDWNIGTGEVYYSSQWARLLGFEPEEVGSTTQFFFARLHPDDAERVRRLTEEHLAGRTAVKQDEVRLRTKAGDYRWFSDRGKVVARDAAGRPTRMVGTITDITERIEVRQRLAAFAKLGWQLNVTLHEREAAQIIAGMADELFGWDAATLDVYEAARDRCRSVLNVDIVEGRREDVPPSYGEREPTPRMRRAITQGAELLLREAPYAAEAGDVPFGDTSRRSASLMIVPLREGTRVVGLLSIQSYRPRAYTRGDLEALQTMADHGAGALARIQTIRALGASEERFRLVWESATDGLRLTDAAGRIVAVNEAFCRIVGKARSEIEGRLLSEAYAEPDGARILARHRERVAGRAVPPRLERQMTLWDGRSILLEVSNGFIETEPGCPLLLGVFRDITERRRAEQEREKMQTRLWQNQKFEALGTLAGGVAHDFNNILMGVMNYTTLAREDCPASHPEIRDYLGEVLKGGQRAKELVRQILQLSRAEEVARAPVQLATVVREALSLLRSTIPAAVEIRAELDERVPPVLANATQIHQIVMNLGINAAHAMGTGAGILTVRLTQRNVDAATAAEVADLKPGIYVGLEVRDTGCGMEPAVATRIFEPFFTTKKIGEGTGLGLAVVRGVVRSHQGAISMRTQPGAGTVFELFFPPLAVAELSVRLADRAFPRGRGERILLVDDEALITRSMQLIMERFGYVVTVCNRPEHALERFAAKPEDFDLVITDYQMPGMNGVDLALKIRALRPALGVLIASGFSGDLTDEKIRALGLNGLIRKPVDLMELAELLARMFGRAG